jgi:hypothetical protein
MLKAIPNSWFSWDFTVTANDQPIANIDISWWREKGELTVQGKAYQVYREGLMNGRFILEANGAVLARAEKPSAFHRAYIIEHAGKSYTLRAKSAFGREFLLLDGEREVGAISPEGIFTHKANVSLPETLPLPVRVFIIWLTVILWKRAADAATT